MRVLIVGTVPPPGGEAARGLAAVASARRADGDEVEILSPDPRSAAHRSARVDGLFLAVELAWLSRKFDALELRVEPGIPCQPTTTRTARAAFLLALGVALGRYREVTLRLDSPVPIPGGLGGRATAGLWSHAHRIVVQSTADRSELLKVPGLDSAHVVVETPDARTSTSSVPWPDATEPDLRRAVLGVVRARSQADRRAASARELIGVERERATPARARGGPSTVGIARVLTSAGARRIARRARAVKAAGGARRSARGASRAQ